MNAFPFDHHDYAAGITPVSTEDLRARYGVEIGPVGEGALRRIPSLDFLPAHEACRKPQLCQGNAHVALCATCRGETVEAAP